MITSPLAFAATANVIVHCGARPFFVDAEIETMNLSPQKVREFLKRECTRDPKTGRPCDMRAFEEIAAEHQLWIIEDAAHAIEALDRGRKVGTIGDVACFSFYVTKNLVTGEGGMVTTNREELARRIKVQALHGLSADAWQRYSDAGFKHYEVTHAPT